jgi:hypothetical protein
VAREPFPPARADAAALASAPPEIVVMTDDIASTRSSTFARAKGLRGGRVARDGRRREKRAIARSHRIQIFREFD